MSQILRKAGSRSTLAKRMRNIGRSSAIVEPSEREGGMTPAVERTLTQPQFPDQLIGDSASALGNFT